MGFIFDSTVDIKLYNGTKVPNYDSVNNCTCIRDIYHKAAPTYTGPYSLPILWDKKSSTIVSNDSLDIVKMFNSNFNAHAKVKTLNMLPEEKKVAIEGATAGWLLNDIGRRVY